MPEGHRTLVTGALGCLGAWTLKALLDSGRSPSASTSARTTRGCGSFCRTTSAHGVTLVEGDVTDAAAIGAALDEHEVTNVVHLAALQVPFCRADPERGARVNVHGTVVVLEAIKARLSRIRGLAYASSTAVYNAADPLPLRDWRHRASTLYGVFKLANEGTARVTGTTTTCLDRDPAVRRRTARAVTRGSRPGSSLAMEAAARGEVTRSRTRTRADDFAPDVGRAFALAAELRADGAHVANFPGAPSTMQEVVDAIEAAAPAAAGQGSREEGQLPFPESLQGNLLERLVGRFQRTPLAEGGRDHRPPPATTLSFLFLGRHSVKRQHTRTGRRHVPGLPLSANGALRRVPLQAGTTT